MIEIAGIKDFNTDHIFDCGQCFRWNREPDGSYTGIAGARPANIAFRDDAVFIDTADDGDTGFWRNYLDLDRDYGQIKQALASEDEIIRKAIEYGHGIRILNQNRWETLISFIISQNNNIPRIKGCIENLCRNFGEPAGVFRGYEYYQMPKPQVLAALDAEDLAPVKLGYRAKYIIETSKQIAADGGEEFLDSAFDENTSGDKVYEYLTGLCGVGPKVANCIMLFCMQQYDSFPVDVWVKRVMNRLYGFDESDIKGMKAFAADRYMNLGGFAQQYLFYYIRSLEK